MLLAREDKSDGMEDTQNIHIDAIPDSNRDRREGPTGREIVEALPLAIGHARTVGEKGKVKGLTNGIGMPFSKQTSEQFSGKIGKIGL